MDTNFFNQIAQIDFAGDLQLVISKGEDNSLIVSTLLQNPQCGDNAKILIIPLLLRGTPQELDEGYVATITTPIEKASGLMDNMGAFVKQLEAAQKQSTIEKCKSDKQKKEQEAKDKKYMDVMAKVDELEKEGKHREAWMKVPEPTDHPEKTEEIRRRKTALSEKFAPDLFGITVSNHQKEEQPTNANLDGHGLSATQDENIDDENIDDNENTQDEETDDDFDDEYTEDENNQY